MLRFLPIVFLVICPFAFVLAQSDYKTHSFSVQKEHTFNPRTAKPAFNALLKNVEAPAPDGNSYRSFLMRQKIESRKNFPLKKSSHTRQKTNNTPQPVIGKGMGMTRLLGNGTVIDFTGGIPNDNTLAVSNDGIILSAVNSVIWGYDLRGDSAIFTNTYFLGLGQFADVTPGHNYYDPKLIYDESADRFILVFLKDSSPSTSGIVVCFSSSNDPLDPWNVYILPGNPLNNDRWTDFPAINVTENELFITGNLIIPNEPWQVGFDGSVIWQLDKNAAYENSEELPSRLYSDLRYNGDYMRNIHPVTGTSGNTETQYLLSNRNFDITNDTIFVMEINGLMDDPETGLEIHIGKSNIPYGVPPNGRQADTDLSDPTKGLQTNDGRVLGAITNEEWIQFVSTTVNPETGLAGIYHGFIDNPGKPEQEIRANILGDPILDFGYPNIAFTGNECCDVEAIIGLNFTSPDDFPGVGTFYFGNDTSYSEFLRIKNGMTYVDKHSDSYERWGDYFGIQSKYNEAGKVWTAGYYGVGSNNNSTWMNELSSPDSMKISTEAIVSGKTVFCEGRVEIIASGGMPPYSYSFNSKDTSSFNFTEDICNGDTVVYSVTDSRGCVVQDTVYSDLSIVHQGEGAFPNPFTDQVVSQFRLESNQQVSAYIFDLKGALVSKILDVPGKKGINELRFNLSPLRAGSYILKVMAGENEILTEKIVKEY